MNRPAPDPAVADPSVTDRSAAPAGGEQGPFAHLPTDPPTHFRLNFYAVVHRVLWYLDRLAGETEEDGGRPDPVGDRPSGGTPQTGRPAEGLEGWLERYPFLRGYLDELLRVVPHDATWDESLRWWREEILAWERPATTHLPLAALADASGLSWRSRLALMTVGLPEEDSRFGTVFAELQSPLPHRRPCVELVGRILAGSGGGVDPWAVCRPLRELRLAEPLDAGAPRAEWVLRVPDVLWDAARGEAAPLPDPRFRLRPPDAFPLPGGLVFPQPFLDRLAQVPALLRGGRADALLVRGSRGSERLTVAGSVARVLSRRLLVAPSDAAAEHGRLLGPLCVMTRAVPALVYDLGPGETADVPDFAGYPGPVVCLLGSEGGLRGGRLGTSVTLELPSLGREERLRHWRAGFGDHPVRDLEEIVDRFHLPGRYIRDAAARSVARTSLEGRDAVTVRDVREGCRLLNRQLLDTLAEHLEVDGLASGDRHDVLAWEPLVVEDAALEKLGELLRRCRHRERLLGRLGVAFGSNANRGVRALFRGPSGTGKTLAARILAAKVGMDLYRVDLASVVNKYIGETEKNLHRVLTTAEELDVVLLLDEGDALLGSRTEVKSSNDRYANLETNYLLQRLEGYRGIVLVTTNLGENIDRAFQRRMDLMVDFLPPRADARLRIWRLHLPDDHAVPHDVLADVAARCRLTGAQIRNAAELATLLAVDEAAPRLGPHHLVAAVSSEYRKAGGTCPLQTPEAEGGRAEGLGAFLDAMSG